MPQDLDPAALARNPIAAGLAGSLIALRFAPGGTWLERFGNVAAGTSAAAWLGPALAEWMGVNGPAAVGALCFLLGLFGLSLASAAMQAIRDLKLAEIVSGWISRKG